MLMSVFDVSFFPRVGADYGGRRAKSGNLENFPLPTFPCVCLRVVWVGVFLDCFQLRIRGL
jgi:hypothetical protein